MKLEPFPKRTYGSLKELFADLAAVLSNSGQVRIALRGDLVSAAFRERLMLVVTQVNDCRYCSRLHAAQALWIGISAGDVALLKMGEFPAAAPPSEAVALRFARHWAECGAHPGEMEIRRLVEAYGQETADAIQIILRMIRIGNLTGNTWDSWLYRLSSGRWGLPGT